MKRREFLYGIGVGAAGALPVPPLFARTARALGPQASGDGRILVVLEMSGGNDGLNTVVPYGDDAYYKHRPKGELGIRPARVRKIDEHFGFNSGMTGFERLYKDGKLAIVSMAADMPNPSFSHFTSMAYWRTGRAEPGRRIRLGGPHCRCHCSAGSGEFPGRNIDARQSLAVPRQSCIRLSFSTIRISSRAKASTRNARSSNRWPIQARWITRRGDFCWMSLAAHRSASVVVKEAWANYKSPVDYGITGLDLPKVAALIQAGFPSRLYYVAYRNNAFDTHVFQGDLHQRLAGHLYVGCRFRIHDRSRTHRPGRRCRGDDVFRVRTARSGESEPRDGITAPPI